jgi:SpoVK/Ycf46/Vps4 family AAA+-type ATPase
VLDEWGFGRKLSLGKGVNALFAGPTGTGKTMAAEIIANELGLELYKIDLSSVVSKYIGETEQNLDRIFTAAQNANVILFIDEADALFGKRSEVRDSHDRYANIEIAYLLQKMEQYEGIAILATNLRQNMDEAFIRRLQFIVEFPFPDEAHRYHIWQRHFPPEAPRDEEIDYASLARLRISGGNIKNIVLAAAFLAATDGGRIGMEHMIQAARREYQKLGKPLSAAELGLHAAEVT